MQTHLQNVFGSILMLNLIQLLLISEMGRESRSLPKFVIHYHLENFTSGSMPISCTWPIWRSEGWPQHCKNVFNVQEQTDMKHRQGQQIIFFWCFGYHKWSKVIYIMGLSIELLLTCLYIRICDSLNCFNFPPKEDWTRVCRLECCMQLQHVCISLLNLSCTQSHCIKVMQWALFMKQNLKCGLIWTSFD